MTWSRLEIRQARQIHLKPVLEQLGYRLIPRPDANFAVNGLAHEIIIKEHYWTCPDSGQSGNAMFTHGVVYCTKAEDFFMKIRGVTFNEAMTLLSGNK